ncbi:hypothetical protein Q6253_30265, partial [Klebsiella quasipneumoniae]
YRLAGGDGGDHGALRGVSHRLRRRDLPDTMPQYQVNKIKNAKTIAQLNENRQGSLLDFIEDFCKRFPKNVDDYETLLTDNR